MKRAIILTIAMTALLSVPCFASPYSAETEKLMKEAGLNTEYNAEDILRRQEALKSGKANESTTTKKNGQNKANKTLKSRNDEYRIVNGGGKDSVKVTDTDDLHIYSNDYNAPSGYGAKFSYDEFKVGGKETPVNDGYGEGGFDEIHINENYKQNVWHPEHRGNRIKNFDEFRYPDEM